MKKDEAAGGGSSSSSMDLRQGRRQITTSASLTTLSLQEMEQRKASSGSRGTGEDALDRYLGGGDLTPLYATWCSKEANVLQSTVCLFAVYIGSPLLYRKQSYLGADKSHRVTVETWVMYSEQVWPSCYRPIHLAWVCFANNYTTSLMLLILGRIYLHQSKALDGASLHRAAQPFAS